MLQFTRDRTHEIISGSQVPEFGFGAGQTPLEPVDRDA